MTDLLTILQGDSLEKLRTLESESVQVCVTSPPYWGLRDYGHADQLGLEKTGMVAIQNARKAILIELNPDYCAMIERRCQVQIGLPIA